MTPREVIRRNLERDNPPRIGMHFDGGRFIAKNYPDLKGIGIQPEWDEWAYQVFLSHAQSAGVV